MIDMHAFSYPARFAPAEEGGFIVTFRDFPYGVTEGDNHAEAMVQATDLLESLLAHYVHDGSDLPSPSKPRRNEVLISPSAVTSAQVALYTAMRREGVSHKELAKRLRLPVAEVRALTDLSKYPPLEKIERALTALGHRLTVTLEAAE
jgi:antitoxin HicB